LAAPRKNFGAGDQDDDAGHSASEAVQRSRGIHRRHDFDQSQCGAPKDGAEAVIVDALDATGKK